jgi:hypothetical protein
MIMIDHLKKVFGEARLARLAKMPLVAESKGGLDAHLQEACKDAASVKQALIKALKSAGSKPTRADLALDDNPAPELQLQGDAAAETQTTAKKKRGEK